jgi:hypothetical protein
MNLSKKERHPEYHARRMHGRSNGWRSPFGRVKEGEEIWEKS